ncbi:2-amino-4-hydroxy-6-hydroxymethyldihydropteridine pyrophosphokinase [Betaproteobacteria bacterium]|nr:2-amino-4-hydroxy-6-hydroxymethyldihydropteridine pyrophosphokinase [Betaproteobacteria bacterium]GHU24890.1 2-amino-4-hydroxy-6-hydroxymethyldihydropteridine pyrophosphokinase [Betaproteobacteria bacterium]
MTSPAPAPGFVRAYVAFGANLGDPFSAFTAARAALAALPHTQVVAHSSCYRSAPVGVPGEQPDYLNAVIALDTALAPPALLDALLAIETRGGRTRETTLAPRTIDLDLLLHGDAILNTPTLTLPHPRLHLRAFVLRPLAELAPQLVVPGIGAVKDLLPGVADQRIEQVTSPAS